MLAHQESTQEQGESHTGRNYDITRTLSQHLTKLVNGPGKVAGSALILCGCPTQISGLQFLYLHLQRHGCQHTAQGQRDQRCQSFSLWDSELLFLLLFNPSLLFDGDL